MLTKKVCLLGSFGVGKTSLIEQFVFDVFTDTYLTTVGVKIDKKTIKIGGKDVSLLIWDLAGRENFLSVSDTYLRGMSGYMLVADGTRAYTLDSARGIHATVREAFPDVPFNLIINKLDLDNDWEIKAKDFNDFSDAGVDVIRTSAKTAEGLEEAFLALGKKMTDADNI
ncbi:MAG: GTP-binding protein [Spirochaetales bacterium]|nr:MAG: GTP-binding protein [Spirochaetales bacterium]